jgi:hypothetical protein
VDAVVGDAEGEFSVEDFPDESAASSAEAPAEAGPALPPVAAGVGPLAGAFGEAAPRPEPVFRGDRLDDLAGAESAPAPSNGSSGDSGAAFFAARGVVFFVARRVVFFRGWAAGVESAGVGGWFSSLTGCSFGLAWGRTDGSTSG